MSVTSSVNSTNTSNESSEQTASQPATHSVVVKTNAAEETETQADVFVQAGRNE